MLESLPPYAVPSRVPGKSRLGVYVHVPFCAHICPYCDFVKTSRFSRRGAQAYFGRCLEQAKALLGEVPPGEITVYFGGGTPGLFPGDMYAPLLEFLASKFTLEEVTLETNPLTNRPSLLAGYRALGVGRITLGAQALHGGALDALGRRHTPADVLRSLEVATREGLTSIQVDLMYGAEVPGRRLGEEVAQLVAHGATGISLYGLTVESRTEFARRGVQVDEGRFCREYAEAADACESLGLVPQEISNFSAVPCVHNALYWSGLPYIGIGTGAHGFLHTAPYGQRYRVGNSSFPARSPGDDVLDMDDPGALFSVHPEPPRTKEEAVREMVFTLLRTPKGIPRAFFLSMGLALPQDVLAEPLATGGLVWDGEDLRLGGRAEHLRADYWAGRVDRALQP